MSEEYKLPMAVSVALATARLEFLRQISAEDMAKNEDCRRLLGDLIEDRAKLRGAVRAVVDQAHQMQKNALALEVKAGLLLDVLDGVETESEVSR